MNLGEFFTLDELTRTQTGLYNRPTEPELVNLTRLVALVLDPIREASGRIDPTSGFRSFAVNSHPDIRGAANSFHLHGLACDIVSPSFSTPELFDKIRALGLPIDKAILETLGGKNWIHIQIKPAGIENRGRYLLATEQNGKTVYEVA